MTTKYDVGDTALVPFKITEIWSRERGDAVYEGYINLGSEPPVMFDVTEVDEMGVNKDDN